MVVPLISNSRLCCKAVCPEKKRDSENINVLTELKRTLNVEHLSSLKVKDKENLYERRGNGSLLLKEERGQT